MYISLVTETYLPQINGVALTLQQEALGLQARGHRIQLVRPAASNESLVPDEGFETLTVGALPLPRYQSMNLGWSWPGWLRRVWQQHRPDVVYIATEGLLGWQALRAANQLKIPVISGFHTHFHQYSRHYSLGWLANSIFSYLRYFHNCTHLTLVPTASLQRELLSQGLQRVEVSGRGVDLERFSPKHRNSQLRHSWGLEARDLAVIHVGRLAAEKNIELVIRLFSEILDVEPSAKLILVGDGPLRPSLEQRYPEFIYCGTQTGQALSEHYASADMMLFPSLTETFGNVVLEAMASGLVLAAFDQAAAQEYIEPWLSGILAPAANEQQLLSNILALLENPTRMAVIRRAARQRVLSQGWECVVESFEQILLRQLQPESLLSEPTSLMEAKV